MLKKAVRIFKDKELRNKIIYVAVLLVIFRWLAQIPIPIVDHDKLSSFYQGNQIFGLYSVFTGGAMEKFSIVMLGVGPYITSSIIMQLLTMIFPSVKEMYQESGEAGRQKFNQYTRYLTVPLGAMQSFAMITLLKNQGVIGNISNIDTIMAVTTITAGTILLMWMGELISEKKIGNGVSLLIFAGIVANLPMIAGQTMKTINGNYVSVVVMIILAIIVVMGVIFVTEAQRNIPVSYARRVRGSKTYGGVSTFLPLRVNSAGMIPLIFAMSIMLFPGIIAAFFVNNPDSSIKNAAILISNTFQPGNLIYGVLYFLMVFLFTYFYTSIVFDPKNVAENLQKHGGFVPGIRPGTMTAEFLGKVTNRITFAGGLFLAIIAILPFLGQIIAPSVTTMTIGGASILIVVGVVLDSIRQIDSQLTMRDYDEI